MPAISHVAAPYTPAAAAAGDAVDILLPPACPHARHSPTPDAGRRAITTLPPSPARATFRARAMTPHCR
jgi:hypothetical protein